MKRTAVKMLGLALMVLSVFMILFGLHLPAGAPGFAGPLLAWTGVALLLAGTVLYVVLRDGDAGD